MFETNFMPFVFTDTVILDENSIRAKCFIRSKQSEEMPFWMKEEEISSYIRIIFFAVAPVNINGEDPMENRLQGIHGNVSRQLHPTAARNRIKKIFDIGARGGDNLIDWENVVARNFPHKIMTLKEAREYTQDNMTTNSILDMDSGNISDIFFEFELENMNFPISPTVNDGPRKIELFGFSYVDVRSMQEDFGDSFGWGTVDEMLENTGNLSYSLLLDSDASGRKFIPRTKTILVTESGSPYIGDYHYHGPENPGPDGYIGYIAGPADHPNMSSMPRLYKREVPNNKIIARQFISEPTDTGFYGAMTESIFQEQESVPVGSYPNTAQYRANNLSRAEFDVSLRNGANLFINNFYQKQVNQPGLKITTGKSSNPITWIKTSEMDSDIKGYQATQFGIMFDRLIRNNSRYGFFLDLVRQNGPISYGNITISEQEMIRNSRIVNLSIYRKRLGNEPYSNNPVGTKVYDVYDTDEIGKFMGSASDIKSSRFYKSLKYTVHPEPKWYKNQRNRDESSILGLAPELDSSTRNPIATISEVPIERDSPGQPTEKYVRYFQIKDYEMYRDINFGMYTYEIVLFFEDNIKSTILVILSSFQRLIKRYKTFLSYASRPYRASGEASMQNGSYDVVTGKYTESFKRFASQNYESSIANLVNLYASLVRLLSGRDVRSEDILNAVLPSRSGGLEEGQSLLNTCNNLLSLYLEMLNRDDKQNTRSSLSDYQYSTTQTRSARKNPETIYIREQLDISVEAFKDGTVMASYDINQELASIVQSIRQERTRRNQSLEDIELLPGQNSANIISSMVSSLLAAEDPANFSRALDRPNNMEALRSAEPFSGLTLGPFSTSRSMISADSLLVPPEELLERQSIPVTLQPSSILTSIGSVTKRILDFQDYRSLSPEDRAVNNAMVQQIVKTDPSLTKDQLEKKNISLSEMPAGTGISLGIPKLNIITSGLSRSNASTVKNNNIKSSGLSKFVESSIFSSGVSSKIMSEISFEKQKITTAKQDLQAFPSATTPEDTRKSMLVRKILGMAAATVKKEKTPKSNLSKLNKIMENKSTITQSQNNIKITGRSSLSTNPSYNIFQEKHAIVNISIGMVNDNTRAKTNGFSPSSKADAKIDAIESVIMVSATPTSKEKDFIPVNNVTFVTQSELSPQSPGSITSSRRGRRNTSRTNTTPGSNRGGSY